MIVRYLDPWGINPDLKLSPVKILKLQLYTPKSQRPKTLNPTCSRKNPPFLGSLLWFLYIVP